MSKVDLKGLYARVVQRTQPTIADLLANFAGAVKRFVIDGGEVSEPLFKQRLGICRKCVFWNERAMFGLGQCGQCGCTRIKLFMTTEHCPQNKWPTVLAANERDLQWHPDLARQALVDRINRIQTGPHVPQVLVVDDNADDRFFLKRLLEGYQCEAAEAANGREAVDKILDGRFDFVFLDLRMPGLSGLDVIEIVRKHVLKTEFILVVSSQFGDLMQQALSMGPMITIPKPVNEAHLDKLLKRKVPV